MPMSSPDVSVPPPFLNVPFGIVFPCLLLAPFTPVEEASALKTAGTAEEPVSARGRDFPPHWYERSNGKNDPFSLNA